MSQILNTVTQIVPEYLFYQCQDCNFEAQRVYFRNRSLRILEQKLTSRKEVSPRLARAGLQLSSSVSVGLTKSIGRARSAKVNEPYIYCQQNGEGSKPASANHLHGWLLLLEAASILRMRGRDLSWLYIYHKTVSITNIYQKTVYITKPNISQNLKIRMRIRSR